MPNTDNLTTPLERKNISADGEEGALPLPAVKISPSFENGSQGYAEMASNEGNDLLVKTSTDGTMWKTAFIASASDGRIATPFTNQNNNLLNNAQFTINQRGFLGGALTEGQFGHDRWSAAMGGAQYSVDAAGVVTLTSGGLRQVIEIAGVANVPITISATDVVGDGLAINLSGATAIIPPGMGRQSTTLVVPSTHLGNLVLELRASNATQFQQIKCEIGWEGSLTFPESPALELTKALRYFYRLDIPAYSEIFLARVHAARDVRGLIQLPGPMRIAPAANWGGASNFWAAYSSGQFSYVNNIALWKAERDRVTLKLTPDGSFPFHNVAIVRQGSADSSFVDFSAEF